MGGAKFSATWIWHWIYITTCEELLLPTAFGPRNGRAKCGGPFIFRRVSPLHLRAEREAPSFQAIANRRGTGVQSEAPERKKIQFTGPGPPRSRLAIGL